MGGGGYVMRSVFDSERVTMTLFKTNRYLLASLAVAVVLSLFVGSWPLLLFGLCVITMALPLPKKISSMVAFRVFLSIMLILSLVQLEAVIFYVAHIHADVFVYNILNATIASVIFIRYGKQKFSFSRDDVVVLIIPLIVVAALVASMLNVASKEGIDVAIVQKITSSSDESAHLNLFATEINNGSNIPNISYPAGWHTATSVVVSSVVNLKDDNFQDTVRAYWAMKLFTVFLAVMATIALFIVTSRAILKNNKPYYLLFSLITIFLAGITIIPNMEINAFFNYVAQYAYVLTAFALIFAIDNDSKKIIYASLAILVAAAIVSWVLIGLILLAIVLAVLLSDARKVLENRTIRLLWQPVCVAALGLGIILLATNNVFSTQFDKLEHPEGWIESFNFVVYIVLAVFWFALHFYKNLYKDMGKTILAVDIYFFIIAGLLVAITLRQYGTITYYFIKMMMPIVLVATPIMVVELVAITEKNKNGQIVPYFILVLIALSVSGTIGSRIISLTGKSILNQTYLHKTADLGRAKQLSDVFSKNKFDSYKYVYVYDVDSDTTLDQMVYQLMAAAIYDRNNNIYKMCNVWPGSGYYGDNSFLLGAISEKYIKNGCIERLKVIVSPETYPAVKQYISDKNIIVIDK